MGSIFVRNVGKAYKQYSSRFGRLIEWVFPFSGIHHTTNWVLKDINLEISAGEAVGIIGINGAGKSTLLKIITGTTAPTTGSIEIRGRLAALLELGMGFHPDFTGRQNVFMAGQLLGLSIPEIERLMPEIESFAEIGTYIDQPVRIYSSGMQVRLAFSVATAVRPDILIVDEALSVGDIYFQHKSFERIREFRKLGTTLLIVSHDKEAVLSVCDRAILLNAGEVGLVGNPEEVLDFYNALLVKEEKLEINRVELPDGKTQTISGTREASISDVILLNGNMQNTKVVDVGDFVSLIVRSRIHADIPKIVLGLMIKDRTGNLIFGTNTHHLQKTESKLRKDEFIEFCIKFTANLGPGTYSVSIALTDSESHQSKNYEWRDLALIFQVINKSKEYFIGSNWLNSKVEIKRENSNDF